MMVLFDYLLDYERWCSFVLKISTIVPIEYYKEETR